MERNFNLKDLFHIGSSKRVLKSQWQSYGVPFYRGREITKLSQDGYVDNELFISEELYKEYSEKFGAPAANDIVVTAIGTIGNSYIVRDGDKFYFKDASVLWLKRNSEVLSEYVNFWLQSSLMKDQLDEGNGATVDTLTINKLKNLLIYIPSITEQKRIVAILDQIFADIEQARANTEQNLKNARELFESYLQQVFSQRGDGWVERSLKDIALDFGRGKSKHRPRNDPYLYDGHYPFIQTGDVRNSEHLIVNYSSTYNENGLAQSKLWPKGTICITIAANIAETGILDFDACFPDSVIGIVVNPDVTLASYVEYLLQSFKLFLKSKGQGSAQDNINIGTFNDLLFPFPSIEAQKEIVDSLGVLMRSVQDLELGYTAKLNQLDELKKSILHKAFSGELTKTGSIVAA